MPFLEILHFTGDIERRELTKQSPLTIGSHPSNDVRVDEEAVEIMHCRISWAQKGYEAVAAGVAPLDINSVLMQRKLLQAGDVLRFGSVDVRYRDSADDGAAPPVEEEASSLLGLKPLTEEVASRPSAPPRSAPPSAASLSKAKPADMAAALDALAAESRSHAPARPSKPAPSPRAAKPADDVELLPDDPEEPAPEGAAPVAATTISTGRSSGSDEIDDGLSDRMRSALRSQQWRPGEEDPLRSPLVLGLVGGAAALILMTAIFYFVATRQTTQQAFDAAKAYYDEGNFIAAIDSFQTFVVVNPKHNLTSQAKTLLGQARVRQLIEGASPKFDTGLTQLRTFIDDEKDLEHFETLHPDITQYARSISLGAAQAAGRQFKPELLDISRQARTILRTYAPKDAPPTETLEQIERSLRVSEAAILKDSVYKEHVAEIEQLITKEPLRALQRRRDLLVRYPDFERDRKITALTEQALTSEKSRSLSDDLNYPSLTDDHEWGPPPLALVFQGRIRTDEVAVGKAVIALAQNCCYGVEIATGQPLWRRVIGFDTPFFPILEDRLPSVILFDTQFLELVRLHQLTGELVWRLPVDEPVSGQPLLTGDTLYVATATGRLLAVDRETGELSGQVQFSQPISGPAELQDGQRLVVAGDEEVLYTLTKRPLAVETVSYLGQASESIQAPLMTMASYLLMVENGASQATLRLLDARQAGQPLKQVASAPVPSRVVDAPVIRGRDLFVPGVGERVSAYSLSDDPGQPPLTVGPNFRAESALPGTIYLMTGPDRQLWMATGGLARLRLTTDSLQPDGDPVAFGTATQPLQFIAGSLFNARSRPYSRSVILTRTDRDDMTSDWQAVLGSPILAWTSRASGSMNIAVVNDAGQTFRIGERQLADARFLTDASTRLPLHPDLTTPLFANALSQDRLGVAMAGPEPRVWILNAAGQVEANPTLPDAPQGPPVSVGRFILTPLPGRVHALRLSGVPALQDFALPTGDDRQWCCVTAVSDVQAVAVSTSGQLSLLRINEQPRASLGQTAEINLGQPVRFPAVADGGLFAIVDGSDRLSVFDAERLEPRGARTWPAPLSNSPWIVDGSVFVEVDRDQLVCVNVAPELPEKWTFDLSGAAAVGIGLWRDQLVIVQESGVISFVLPETGEVSRRVDLSTPLSHGPLSGGGQLFVGSVDGAVLRVPENEGGRE